MKYAIGTLQFYLVNNPFTLLTDHAPLLWLHKVKYSNPRVLRWYLSLLPFSFNIRHCKGSINSNTDYLSHKFDNEYCAPRGGFGKIPAAAPASPDETMVTGHLPVAGATFLWQWPACALTRLLKA